MPISKIRRQSDIHLGMLITRCARVLRFPESENHVRVKPQTGTVMLRINDSDLGVRVMGKHRAFTALSVVTKYNLM